MLSSAVLIVGVTAALVLPPGTPRPAAEFRADPLPGQREPDSCRWFAFSPDGRFLAADLESWRRADGRLLIWDTDRWAVRHRWTVPSFGWRSAGGFDPKSGRLMYRFKEGFRLRDPAGASDDIPVGGLRELLGGEVAAVRFAADGRRLALGLVDGRAADKYKLTVGTYNPTAPKTVAAQFDTPDLGRVLAADLSPGLTHLAVGHTIAGDDNRPARHAVELFDLATGGRPLGDHQGHVSAVAFSSDGTRLATGDGSGTIALWEVPSGRLLQAVRGPLFTVPTLAFRPDGRVLPAGTFDRGGDPNVWLLDGRTGRLRRSFAAGWTSVLRLAYHPDGRLATIDADLRIRVWSLDEPRE